jgi:hypothetical protein
MNEEEYREEFLGSASAEMDLRSWGEGSHDMTELLFSPSEWLHQVLPVESFASSLTWLSPIERAEFVRDPDRFLATREIDEWVTESLMQAYWRFVGKPARRAARSRSCCVSTERCRPAWLTSLTFDGFGIPEMQADQGIWLRLIWCKAGYRCQSGTCIRVYSIREVAVSCLPAVDTHAFICCCDADRSYGEQVRARVSL